MLLDSLRSTVGETCWVLEQSSKGLSFVFQSWINFGSLFLYKELEESGNDPSSAKRNC